MNNFCENWKKKKKNDFKTRINELNIPTYLLSKNTKLKLIIFPCKPITYTAETAKNVNLDFWQDFWQLLFKSNFYILWPL